LFTTSENPALEEAIAALQALGYSERETKKVHKQLLQEPVQSTDEYLRAGLKLMMKK
jgi:Holliday junction DNA helicase RuvA